VREITPAGPGAVSVLSVEGPGALELLGEVWPRVRRVPIGGLRTLRLPTAGEAPGTRPDEVLLLAASAEHVELHLHGSPPLVARVRDLLRGRAARRGGRPAEPPSGVEARAREALAHAACESGARILLDQAQGALRRELEGWVELPAGRLAERRAELARRAAWTRYALEPASVVLAGPANSGKSTLFNLAVGRERTAVSPVGGTTRDAIRERALLGRWPVELVDTAPEDGIEDPGRPGGLERASRERGREARRGAQLVVWLDPAGGAPPAGPGPAAVVVRSRADEPPAPVGPADLPALSALARPEEAVEILAALLRRELSLPEEPWSPGAPCPFEPALLELCDRQAAQPSGGRRRLALERASRPGGILGPPPRRIVDPPPR